MSQPYGPPNNTGPNQPPFGPPNRGPQYAPGPHQSPPPPGYHPLPSFPLQAPPPKKGKWWSGRLAVGLGAGLLGLFIGTAGSSGSAGTATTAVPAAAPTVTVTAPAEPGKPAPTVTVTAPAKPAPTVTVTAKPKEQPKAEAEPAKPAFSDGQYVVGEDIKPGRYRTVENAQDVSTFLCYLDVQDDGDYLAQEVTDKGKTIVVIKSSWKGAVLSSRGCGDWKKER